jgi:alcohol dehydrogenase
MSDIKTKLLELTANQFSTDINDVTVDLGPGDIMGWDSIGQLQLILKIEQTFKIGFLVDDIMSINNLGDIVKIVEKYKGVESAGEESVNETEEEALKVDSQTVVESNETAVDIEKKQSSYQSILHPKQLFVGIGAISEIIKENSFAKVAVVTGSSLYGVSMYNQIYSYIAHDAQVEHMVKPSGEPHTCEINDLGTKLKNYMPDLIIATGGGSVIDAAKLARVLYENPEITAEQLNSNSASINYSQKSKVLAIPTTFGSGAEVSSAAAYHIEGQNSKSIFVNHKSLPDFVILEESVAQDLPKPVLYASAIDALTHAIEAYVSIVENDFVKPMAVNAVKHIISALKDVKDNGTNKNNLSSLMYASYWAGMVQNHCSVGATHSLSHQIGTYGFSHGQANALFLIPVMEENRKATNKYEELIKAAGFDNIDFFMFELRKLIIDMDILSKEKVSELVIHKNSIIEGAQKDITFRTNPKPLNTGDLNRIFNSALSFIS